MEGWGRGISLLGYYCAVSLWGFRKVYGIEVLPVLGWFGEGLRCWD